MVAATLHAEETSAMPRTPLDEARLLPAIPQRLAPLRADILYNCQRAPPATAGARAPMGAPP